ncbi:MAG: S8 family serine peptidase [Actinobacteria bacterium]|nr:S8 family serine peptidase [Actinomycetota bacterium]
MRATLQSLAGVTDVASSLDYGDQGIDPAEVAAATATTFHQLGVAVVAADPDQLASMAASEDPRVVAVEPEHILHAICDYGYLEYLRGYRDAAAHLHERLSESAAEAGADVAAPFADSPSFTWGLQATKAAGSRRSGRGVRVAVLDTGLDLAHPDFAGRNVVATSFVSKQPAQDGHGHGTHCIGTACGPQRPSDGRRYGVAHGTNLFVGKVLSDQGSGSDAGILAGIDWALANGCRVISMSLGADIREVSAAYEAVGRRALAKGALMVAAAGNNASRSARNFGFVGVPANSPSIMAVGAVDARLGIADFSARSNPVWGGQVDIAGPGVGVYSSWPVPTRYRTISGTSMATPHVAGVAALWHEASGATGAALWSNLVRSARRLRVPSVDVGTGLVQAP